MADEIDKLARYADEQERKASQLQVALDSRIVIEQAVGILAERFALSIDEAFELLRRAARDSRRELRGLAAELTQTRVTPAAVVAARTA
jgi:AmiR/NasT family two-component response regulator